MVAVRTFTTSDLWLQIFKQGNVNLHISQEVEHTFEE